MQLNAHLVHFIKDDVCSPGVLCDDFYAPTGCEEDDIISLDDVEVDLV